MNTEQAGPDRHRFRFPAGEPEHDDYGALCANKPKNAAQDRTGS